MQVETILAKNLDDELEQSWRSLQDRDPDLRSPYFGPEFCRIVADAIDCTEIALVSDGGKLMGLFPFHRQSCGRIAPLAGQISDYHGIVGRIPGNQPFSNVLRRIGAQAFDFNHVPASQAAFSAHAYVQCASPFIDLSIGFEPWRLAQRAKSRTLKEVERRSRKLEREIGPLTVKPNDTSAAVWQKMCDWKRESLAQKGVEFILDRPWAKKITDSVRHTNERDFGGMTFSLWAGGDLVAVAFAMRTATTAHGWFAAYNPTYDRYSPGQVLLVEMLKHADAMGITEFDLGRGNEHYKREFGNGSRALCEGSVERVLSPIGSTRRLRKKVQGLVTLFGSANVSDMARRAGNRVLSAGRIS